MRLYFTGIFLSNELWHNELLKGNALKFAIWPMPASEIIKARKVAHLLNEFPLPGSRRNASVELRTASLNNTEMLNQTQQFRSVLKSENLCFKSGASADKILVYVGNADFMKAAKFEANASLIIVPLAVEDFVLSGKFNDYQENDVTLIIFPRHSQSFLHRLRIGNRLDSHQKLHKLNHIPIGVHHGRLNILGDLQVDQQRDLEELQSNCADRENQSSAM